MKKIFLLKHAVLLLLQYLLSSALFAQPVITSFMPTSGPIGTTVIINGDNFNTIAAENIVYFGAVMAVVTSATTTILTVVVPSGSTYQPISVLNKANGLAGYSDQPFIVTFPNADTGFTSNSFAAKVDYATGYFPGQISIGDFDGDGNPDIVVGTGYPNKISVFRNSGRHGIISFEPKKDFLLDGVTSGLSIGDLDGDGKLDIAAVVSSDKISVFKNTSVSGDISFAPKVDFPTITATTSITMGDLDEDGKLDLVLTIADYFGKVSVLRNQSTIEAISFAERKDFSSGGMSPWEVAIGDIDGDGKPDLAVTNVGDYSIGGYGVSILRNTSKIGDISFVSSGWFDNLGYRTSIAIGDLDGDRKADLAVAHPSFDYPVGSVGVLRNESGIGTVSFEYPKKFYLSNGSPQDIEIGDLDGDGKPDLAVGRFYNSDVGNSNTMSVFKNNGMNGIISFAAELEYMTGNNPGSVAIGDMDGDGKADIITANSISNTISVLKNQMGSDLCNITVPKITHIGSLDLCRRDSVLLITSTAAVKYQWIKDGALIKGATNRYYVATKPGMYCVVVYTSKKCGNVSKPITVTNSCGKISNNISISPNPSHGMVTVTYNSMAAGNVQLNVYDKTGKAMFTKTERAIKGSNTYQLNLSNLINGLYNLQLINGSDQSQVKFIIEK